MNKRTGKYVGTSTKAWSTLDECQFIDKLGSHSDHPTARVQCLRGYIAGLRKRKEWGAMDRFLVLNYAMECLERAEANTR